MATAAWFRHGSHAGGGGGWQQAKWWWGTGANTGASGGAGASSGGVPASAAGGRGSSAVGHGGRAAPQLEDVLRPPTNASAQILLHGQIL